MSMKTLSIAASSIATLGTISLRITSYKVQHTLSITNTHHTDIQYQNTRHIDTQYCNTQNKNAEHNVGSHNGFE
jgi:hypothetical protein